MPSRDSSTSKLVSPTTGRRSSSQLDRGKDRPPFARSVIKWHRATTSLARRGTLSSSAFWAYLATNPSLTALFHAVGNADTDSRRGPTPHGCRLVKPNSNQTWCALGVTTPSHRRRCFATTRHPRTAGLGELTRFKGVPCC